MARRQILRDPLQSRIRQLRDAHEHQFQERGLERRVDLTATAAFDQAVMPNDSASTELAEAWSRAYGRDPDPSDVWDHSIMAVEAILQKIISPDNNSTTLGTLIKNLRDGAHKFEFVLTNDQGGVQTLLAMLQLMWPNPDRHGGPNGRTPTIEEARAVVQLAVTIVQRGRDGQAVRRWGVCDRGHISGDTGPIAPRSA